MGQRPNASQTLSETAGSDSQGPRYYLVEGGRMNLPDEADLLHADFARRGDDLLVSGSDRPTLVILDYFSVDRTPDLHTGGGAVLPAHVIAKLAGPDRLRPDAVTEEAAAASEQTPIGHVETVEGEVIITRADGSQVVATVGTPVFQDDVIVTDNAGSLGLRFVDGMTLSLGSDARMVLDEFVYDPEADEGGGIIEIIQGAFSFISGEAAHMGLDSMVIETPTMTIGIRGTKVVANASAEGETTDVVLLPEDDGTIGKIMIKTDAGEELLEEAFVATTVTSRFLPPAPQTTVPPDWVYSHYSQPLAALPTPTVEEENGPAFEIDTSSFGTGSRLGNERGAHLPDVERFDPTPEAGRSEARVIEKATPEPSTTSSETAVEIEAASPSPSATENDPPPDDTTTLDLVDDPNFGLPTPEPSPPPNQAPTLAAPFNDAAEAEDVAFTYDAAANFADADVAGGDVLNFSASVNGGALPTWLSIDPVTGALSGTPVNADVGSITIDVTATDDAGASASGSFQLTVTNSNDTPVMVTPIADTGTTEDAVFSYDVTSHFADDDSVYGDSLTFSATVSGGGALPGWLSIDPATGALSGTPVNADVGSITIDVTATDDAGASASGSFQLTVANSNDTPVVVTPIADAGTAEDAVFSYDVTSHFADDDGVHGDSLTFSTTQSNGAPLPAWLSIESGTGILTGTPVNADVSAITLTVVATDDAGAETSASFQLTVTNTNDTPVVVTPIADATPLENALFTVDTSSNFADDDYLHGDALTFSAVQSGGAPLPAWLTIDPATGVLSGTPDATQVGIPYTLEVTATDDSGASVTSTFQLSVDNVNDAPVLNVTPSPTLTSVAANSADPAGNTIADIIPDGSITDADGGAVEAIALTGVDDTNGSWEFSTNAGSSWSAVGVVSDNTALLLDGTAMLRFIPDSGYGGSATFTFRAWDETTGSNGQTGVDVSTNGGTTAFSLLSDTGSVSVQGTAPDLNSGAEFQVNTTTADKQEAPSITALEDGGFVVTWQSHDQDGDRDGVYGQRYDSAGSATGAEFQINTHTTGEQEAPSVAGLAGGGFVVIWRSGGQDGDNWGVYGQRYDSGGSAAGSEFQVNTTTTDEQKDPTVAALADGGFVATWESKNQDGDNWGIYGQRYDSVGSPTGSEFRINTTTDDEQRDPSVAVLDDGGFVVTWESKNQDGDSWGVYGQRYDSAGVATGSEFRINTTTTNEQKDPWVASLVDGGFVVTWQSRDQDGDNWGIYGQRYDGGGNPVEFEFQVNQETSEAQENSNVSSLADGGFIVTWQSKNQDGDNWGVFARRFNADGDPLGNEIQINTTSAGEQKTLIPVSLSDGGLAVTWQSKDQDGDDWGIYGHRYDSETASVTVNAPQAEAASMLDFGGSDSFVDAGDPGDSSDDLDPGRGDYTVEAWFYYDGANGRQSIVSKGNDDALDAGFNIFLDDDTLVVRASTDGGLDSAAMKVTMSGSPGWHHVAMVLDQDSGTAASSIRGYLNGSDAGWTTGHGIVFSSTVTTSSSRQIETDERFLIGAVDDNGSAEDFFGAEIADVRVWNTARSQTEIQADLGRTLNGDEPHLIANWQLDDGVGPTASDATGNHDGTLSGGPTWEDALNLTTAQNTALAGRLSASDQEGDTLAYGVTANAANGTAAIDAANGTWTYDPDAGFSGSDGFSYQISDGNGGSDTVTIAVTVTP